MRIKDRNFDLFIPEANIQDRITAMAKQIDQDYADDPPVLIAVLNGAFVFMADLARAVTVPSEITFIKVKSYQKLNSTGPPREFIGLEVPIADRPVVIVEDVVDSGNTIHYLYQKLTEQQPKSIAIATLLFKPGALEHDLDLTYIGFEIPNDFVVGYGLDYDGLGRNLRSIYTLSDQIAS